MKVTLRSRVSSLLAATLLVLILPAAASAADLNDGGHQIGSRDHCVARLQPAGPTGARARIVSETCFGTFSQAIRHATSGHTVLPRGARPQDVSDDMLPEAGTTSTYIIGVTWDFRDYDDFAASRTWEAPDGCDPGHWWVLPDLTGTGWNDKISSSKGYSGCVKFRHFEHVQYGGAVRTCTPNCSYIGDAMNNRTSSLQWDN